MKKSEIEELSLQVVDFAIKYNHKLITLSMIQRKFGASYNQAGKVVDWLEDKGYIESLQETLGAKRKGRWVIKSHKDENPVEENCQTQEPEVLVLTDEDGVEASFEVLDVIEYKGNEYVVLVECGAAEPVEVGILRIDEESGKDYQGYFAIEDEEELMTIFKIFIELNKQKYNFVD